MFQKIAVAAGLLFTAPLFAQEATVDVVLHPAGSFKMVSKEVKGSVTKQNNKYVGKNIVVGLKNVTTGVGLRDTHTKKHLEVDKFPEAVLVSAQGENGKGTGVIKIRGIEQKIEGTYKVEGKKFVASFPLELSKFKIEGIKYMGAGVDDKVNVQVAVPIN